MRCSSRSTRSSARSACPTTANCSISDTVGFIDRLPHALVAAFRATLEEVAAADLILHVTDAAAPDRDRRMAAVRQVLEEVGAIDVPLIEVYNKCDVLTPDERRRLQEQEPGALCISALRREGMAELVDTLASRLALDVRRVTLTLQSRRSRPIARGSPGCIATPACSSTKPATDRCPSSPTCRAGCSDN